MANVTFTKSGPEAPAQSVNVEIPAQNIPSKAAPGLPPIQTIVIIAVVCAVVAWGLVQTVKQTVRGFYRASGRKGDPWWLAGGLRFVSIVFGALCGWLLFDPMGAAGSRWWGCAIGASGGALATIIVQQIKTRIRGGKNAG